MSASWSFGLFSEWTWKNIRNVHLYITDTCAKVFNSTFFQFLTHIHAHTDRQTHRQTDTETDRQTYHFFNLALCTFRLFFQLNLEKYPQCTSRSRYTHFTDICMKSLNSAFFQYLTDIQTHIHTDAFLDFASSFSIFHDCLSCLDGFLLALLSLAGEVNSESLRL